MRWPIKINRKDDWEKVREQILRDDLTKEWFEKETIEQLFRVEIHYAEASEFGPGFFHNLKNNSFIIGKGGLLKTLPEAFSKAIPYTILTQALLGAGYFSLRGKDFPNSVGPKIQSVLQEHIEIVNGIKEASEGYVDHIYTKAFGRGSPLIHRVKEISEVAQKAYKEGEEIILKGRFPFLSPPLSVPVRSEAKLTVNLADLMNEYQTSRSVAVTHFYSMEKALREGRESIWRVANNLMTYQAANVDISPYALIRETYGPGRNFITRVEDFRLGMDDPRSYEIPLS